MVWDPCVSRVGLSVEPIVMVLSPVLPLLLSTDWSWPSLRSDWSWSLRHLKKSRVVRNSSIGDICSAIFPVNEVLCPGLPLLLASNWAWPSLCGNWSWSFSSLKKSRVVWDSSVGDISSSVLPVNEILGPLLPLLLTSNWASPSLTSSSWVSSLKKSRVVWDPGVSNISSAIFPVDEVLSPGLPLLFTSYSP